MSKIRIEFFNLWDDQNQCYVAFLGLPNRAGTEAHFARSFERDLAKHLLSDMPFRPVGEFHITALRAGVEVRRSEIKTREQMNAFVEAMGEAWTAHNHLCYGRHSLNQESEATNIQLLESHELEEEVELVMEYLKEEFVLENEEDDADER